MAMAGALTPSHTQPRQFRVLLVVGNSNSNNCNNNCVIIIIIIIIIIAMSLNLYLFLHPDAAAIDALQPQLQPQHVKVTQGEYK